MLTPDLSPPLSRRSLFRITATAAFGVVCAPMLAGCSDDGDIEAAAEVDQLLAQADLARRDAASAIAASALLADRVGALTTISAQRSAHAEALESEITRARGKYADGSAPGTLASTTTPSTTTAFTTTEPTASAPPPPPGLDQIRSELAESQRSAADLARTLSAHRAGLLGSISAACGTHLAVLLP